MTAALSIGRRSGGAPGVFLEPVAPSRELAGVRLDATAFLGVAPRGPARVRERSLPPDEPVSDYLAGVGVVRSVAVEVTSWSEYRRRYGGYEGAGRLPYAVSAFFAQGGARARVVRIVHGYGTAEDAGGCATGSLARPALTGLVAVTTSAGDPVVLSARDEGVWGDRLRAVLTFTARPLRASSLGISAFEVATSEWVPIGSLVRATAATGDQTLRYVADSVEVAWPDRPGSRRVVTLDGALASAPTAVEAVTAALTVTDEDPDLTRTEQLTGLGLSSDHPRWLARTVIEESELLWPDGGWVSGSLALTDPTLPDLLLASADPAAPAPADLVNDHLVGGVDRSADIVGDDFFDPSWVLGDERPAAGVQCLAEVDDVGLLLAPDLCDPAPLDALVDITDPGVGAGAEFAPCLHLEPTAQVVQPAGLAGLRLDPRVPADLAVLTDLQLRLASFAADRSDLTLLLDAPLGLTAEQIQRWRAAFDSPYLAAYHPWLDVATPDDARDGLVRLNPSAFAAGVIAARELSVGVAFGPANVVVTQAIRPSVRVPRGEHDDLHDDGVNVFLLERDGLRLTGARTLSRDRLWRQLSVSRLVTVIRLTLQRELAWSVFEPSNTVLWTTVRRSIADYLTTLYLSGALRGASSAEAFFVSCDETTMTRNDLDNGRLVALVGVAPAEPVEYIVLRLSIEREATARVEVSRG